MKFSISSGELLKQLQKASGTIDSKPVIAILEDYLFEVKNGTLSISSTDLETSVTSKIDVISDEDGSVAVPGRILLDTLKALPEQPITFNVQSDTHIVELTSAYGKYKMAGDNPADFPERPTPKKVDSITIDASVIHEAISNTLFATSSDELRLAMTGVCVHVDFNKIVFVATDAHKLVKYVYKDITSDTTQTIILPKKALTVLKNALHATGAIDVSFDKSNAFFKMDQISLACRLIDAKYPEYEAVIPKDNPNILTVDRKDFLNSLKRIVIFSNRTTNQVVLDIAEDSLTINAQDLDFSSEANEQLSCTYEGDPIKIGFNARFLIEMLNVMSDEQVILKLSEPSRAGILVPTEADDQRELLMLIMPVMMNY